MNKKIFSKKYVNVKRKFIKINNYFFNKISLCSVLDLTAIDLVMGLNKFQLDRDNVVLISRYSKKFKVKSDLLRNLVCFSRFRTFFVLFASHISLKKFLDNNKVFNSFFLHKSSGLIFFNDYKTFVTFNQSEFQLNSLFNCFFFSYLTFLLYFFMYNLTNYTWNRNNID